MHRLHLYIAGEHAASGPAETLDEAIARGERVRQVGTWTATDFDDRGPITWENGQGAEIQVEPETSKFARRCDAGLDDETQMWGGAGCPE